MYHLQARLTNATLSYTSGKPSITFEFEDKDSAIQMFDELRGLERLDVKIDKHREKRSLDQNSYAWALIGKIADKLRADKNEIYLKMLKRYGQGGVIKIAPTQEEAVLAALKYYEPHEKFYSVKDKYYRVWAGSSGYTTEEMTIFLDGIIEEAKQLGINTLTPDEIAELRSWEESR
jgi:hypothetical protein